MHQMLSINELQKYFALGTCSLEYQRYQTAKTFPPGDSFSPSYPFCTDWQIFSRQVWNETGIAAQHFLANSSAALILTN